MIRFGNYTNTFIVRDDMNHIGVIAKAKELDERRIKSYPYISIRSETYKGCFGSDRNVKSVISQRYKIVDKSK